MPKSPLEISKPGDIGPQMLQQLAALLPPALIAEKIQGMLNATYESGGKVKTDWRAVEAGVKLWMSYQIGMPVQRQVILQQKSESGEETLERLLASPASRKMLGQLLESAPKKQGKAARESPTAEDED